MHEINNSGCLVGLFQNGYLNKNIFCGLVELIPNEHDLWINTIYKWPIIVQ